ncbi:helix-turn-helix domain-containing protein [Mesoterricola silvestris]|uniref:Transcriptional regulator n=1 Tax=Mesoterricola silvestris TaxID=2927979 RepID=A0AA48GTZ9_9BACT|nr:AraC family transcriptional regulator [Mesoterricola silvestris]BDU74027.1 transcriptional regulator [Mesoterricola silvestris]
MPELTTFTPTPLEQAWGLYATAVGSVEGGMGAPPSGWRLLYLVRGEALLGRHRLRVEAGEVVLLDSREGCDLVPDARRGCTLHHVDFGGAWMERWAGLDLFGTPPRVVRAGFDEGLLGGIVKLRELARNPPAGAGLLMAGALGDLLARLEIAGRQGVGEGRQGRLVNDARRILADPAGDRLNLEAAASELGVSYSWFRRSFRAQTGLAPQRYRLLLRLDRACRMLEDSRLTIGAVARALGFSSQAYFARMFRRETGLSPSVWRSKRVNLRGDSGT